MGEELNTLPHANSAEADGHDRKSLLLCLRVTYLNEQREKNMAYAEVRK